MTSFTTARVSASLLFVLAMSAATANGQSSPDGEITIAFDASIASSFLDPGETPGIGSPFVFLYALHDG